MRRKPPPTDAIAAKSRAIVDWSDRFKDLARQLAASMQRVAALEDPGAGSEADRVRRLLREFRRMQSFAATARAMPRPPAEIGPAHDQAVAAFTGIAEAGEQFTAALTTGDELRLAAAANEAMLAIQVHMAALQEAGRAASRATLGLRLRTHPPASLVA